MSDATKINLDFDGNFFPTNFLSHVEFWEKKILSKFTDKYVSDYYGCHEFFHAPNVKTPMLGT
jgi:hypothetical protein